MDKVESLDSQTLVEEPPKPAVRKAIIRAVVQTVVTLALATSITFLVFRYYEQLSRLGPWNYLSTFLIELTASSTIFLPVPGQAYAFAIAGTLNPLLVGLIGGVASALGELTGYFIGSGGRDVIQGHKHYVRFHGLTARWGGPLLFLFAALPVPFDVAGIWAGTARYPIWRFLAYVGAGKIIKVTVVAVAGYYSASWLLRLLH